MTGEIERGTLIEMVSETAMVDWIDPGTISEVGMMMIESGVET